MVNEDHCSRRSAVKALGAGVSLLGIGTTSVSAIPAWQIGTPLGFIGANEIENSRPDDCDSYGGRRDPTCSEEVFEDPFMSKYGIRVTAEDPNVGLSGSLTSNIGIEGGPAYEKGSDEIMDVSEPDTGKVLDLVSILLSRSHPVASTALAASSVAKSLLEAGAKHDDSRTEELVWLPGSTPETTCYATNHRNIEVWVPEGESGNVTIGAFTTSQTTRYGGNIDLETAISPQLREYKEL